MERKEIIFLTGILWQKPFGLQMPFGYLLRFKPGFCNVSDFGKLVCASILVKNDNYYLIKACQFEDAELQKRCDEFKNSEYF